MHDWMHHLISFSHAYYPNMVIPSCMHIIIIMYYIIANYSSAYGVCIIIIAYQIVNTTQIYYIRI